MTRTNWLLVALMGLIAWIAGYALKAPFFGITGVLVLVLGLVAAATYKDKGDAA